MARLGYFLWTIGSLNASTICSLVAKVTNDLPALGTSPCRWRKSAGCGRKLKCQDVKRGIIIETWSLVSEKRAKRPLFLTILTRVRAPLSILRISVAWMHSTNPLWKPISYLWEIISMVTQSRSCSIRVNTRFPPFSATCVIDSFQHSSLISKILNIQQFIHH